MLYVTFGIRNYLTWESSSQVNILLSDIGSDFGLLLNRLSEFENRREVNILTIHLANGNNSSFITKYEVTNTDATNTDEGYIMKLCWLRIFAENSYQMSHMISYMSIGNLIKQNWCKGLCWNLLIQNAIDVIWIPIPPWTKKICHWIFLELMPLGIYRF